MKGDTHTFLSYGEFVARYMNAVSGKYVSDTRGIDNTTSGKYINITDLNNNNTTGECNTVSGGFKSTASSDDSLVSGE